MNVRQTPAAPTTAGTLGLGQWAEAWAVTPRPAIPYGVAEGAYRTRDFLDGAEALALAQVEPRSRNAPLR